MRKKWPYQTGRPGLWQPLKAPARAMRRKPTVAENRLWQAVRRDALGQNFRRQHLIDRFLVDLVCLSARLVVEVDGGIHDEEDRREYDALRTEYLNAHGFRVVRYTNDQVMNGLIGVLADLRRHLAAPIPQPLSPFRGKGSTSDADRSELE